VIYSSGGFAVEKRRRQSRIQRLIRQHAVANQTDLVRLLGDAGFAATQASVSRDLRELGVVKVKGRYQQVAALRPARGSRDGDPLHELLVSAEPVGANLIIVRTRTGAAGTVAVGIDRRQIPEIAGTIAGDDTILVVVKSRSAQGRALALLTKMKNVR
jgi:transcriptional regulator of arginine metabolism